MEEVLVFGDGVYEVFRGFARGGLGFECIFVGVFGVAVVFL